MQWLNVYIDHRDKTTNVGDSPLSSKSNESMNYDEEPSNLVELENENLSDNTSVLNFSSNTHKSNTSSSQQKSLSEIKCRINMRKNN